MSWVDETHYFGPDRRGSRKLRLLDRRREDLAGQPPSLKCALRRLRVQAMVVIDPDSLRLFRDRVAATKALADELGLSAPSAMIAELHRGLFSAADLTALRERVEQQLQALENELRSIVTPPSLPAVILSAWVNQGS